MKNLIVGIFILTNLIGYQNSANAQEVFERINYETLKKAYAEYDLVFFESLKGKTIDIVDNKNKVIHALIPGSSFSPLINWNLNKKANIGEHDLYKSGDTTIISIYRIHNNSVTQYVILKNGPKPRIYFRMGKNNWYKIKRTEDCLIFKESNKPIEYINK